MESNLIACETRALEVEACELDRAINSLLHTHDPQANDWINNFVTLPRAWSVSLYLAFPPPGSAAGGSQDVRFFALNLLLSKIRGDQSQVPAEEAQEIYEALIRQLPLNIGNPQVGARLCLVVSGAAALAGADTCYDLVDYIVGGSVEGFLAVELLISLAEETLHRNTALPWQVGECMQECSPLVITYLQAQVTVPGVQQRLVARVIVCLERWICSGVVLSEFCLESSPFLKVILEALGSSDDATFEGAVAALSELVRAVDYLPGREDAMRVVISAVLAQKGQFAAAMSDPNDGTIKRAQALLSLVSVICFSEPHLLAKGGQDAAEILQWLVIGLGGAGVLGLEGASIAAEAWIRLVAVPKSKRSDLLQSSFFATGAQAILQVSTYPADFNTWEDAEVEKDEFHRFREGLAKDTLVGCFSELGSALLVYIIERLRGANRWQDAEVCLYAAVSLNKEILSSTVGNGDNNDYRVDLGAAKSFFFSIIDALPGRSSVIERDSTSLPHFRLVETTAMLLESYSDWAALDSNALQISLGYCVGALRIPDVRSNAASAFRELCRAAAPSIAATGMFPALMGACEQAISSVGSFKRVSERADLLAIVKGLAQVAAALPLEEAKAALVSLTVSAVSTVKALAGVLDGMDENGPILAEALTVIVVAIDGGSAAGYSKTGPHPGVVIIQEIWPAVNLISTVWAENGDVSSAVCELWSITARKVGGALSGVLTEVMLAATNLFKRHYAPACVDCLVDILEASQDASIFQQVKEHAPNVLHQLSDVGVSLIQISDKAASVYNQTSGLHFFAVQNGHENSNSRKHQQLAAAALQALCRLGRAFLQHHRYILTFTASFSKLISCAIVCLRRKDIGPTLSPVKFLAEFAMGFGYSDEENIDRIIWRIESDLIPYWDDILGAHLNSIVEVALEIAVGSEIVPSTRDALSDIFYGLCLRHGQACGVALTSTLSKPNFPSKIGALNESARSAFVAAVVRQPVHHRLRFRELVGDFARVCQGHMPANVLNHYS
ncbi:hypothetical protein M758_11G145300 [Ceratodon purpureus]|nr:hypothetical protein M758_11G145300 [Ceratodon purpureus]